MTDPLPAVPARWQRALALLVGAAAAVYVLGVLGDALLPAVGAALQILQPVIVAFAIAYLLDPLVDRFEDRGWSRRLAIAVVIALAVVCLGLLVVLVLPSMFEQAADLGPRLSTYGERASDAIHRLSDWLGGAGGRLTDWLRDLGVPIDPNGPGLLGGLQGLVAEIDWRAMAARVTGWMTSAASGGFAVAGFLLNLILIPILSVYLLADIDVIKAQLADLLPPRHRESVLAPLRDIDTALSGFVRGQLMVAGILAALYMIGLALSGTPMGLVIGLLAGAISFVPYLGLLAGLVPALALTALEHGPLSWHVLGVILTFSIAQFLEGNFITPRIIGRTVGLHPVVVIVAVVTGGTLAGLLGMVLAVPTAATAVVLIRRARARYVLSDFFRRGAPPPQGSDRAPPPDETGATPAAEGEAASRGGTAPDESGEPA